MLNKPSKKNYHSLYFTPEEKSSKLGLFSAARVVLPLITPEEIVAKVHVW